MREFMTTYRDYKDRPTALTEQELDWFFGIVKKARKATGCTVDIIPWDHEQCQKKDQNALGLTWTTDPQNTMGADVDTFITVDCHFIDEAYNAIFGEGFRIEWETMEHVIAHEIAHLTVWRHGKKHTALTEEIFQKILAA